MLEAEHRLQASFGASLLEQNARVVLRNAINGPFELDPSEYSFWKLQFKLKWEEGYYNPDKLKPFADKLIWAFTELDYKEPEKEAQLLLQIIDSIFISILRDGKGKQELFQQFLLNKYQV